MASLAHDCVNLVLLGERDEVRDAQVRPDRREPFANLRGPERQQFGRWNIRSAEVIAFDAADCSIFGC